MTDINGNGSWFSAARRLMSSVLRPRFYAASAPAPSKAQKLPRIEDVVANAGRDAASE